jgi:hypothetical protein
LNVTQSVWIAYGGKGAGPNKGPSSNRIKDARRTLPVVGTRGNHDHWYLSGLLLKIFDDFLKCAVRQVESA